MLKEIKSINIKDIELNKWQIEGLPKNPRFIRDERYEQLKKSIQDAPGMLSLRELIVYPYNGKYVVIGWNMRLRACKELWFDEIHCKILKEDLEVEKLKEITIKDNVWFGEDDMDLLANEWDAVELIDWGVEMGLWEEEEVEVIQETDNWIKRIQVKEHDIDQIVDFLRENEIEHKIL